MFPLAISCWSTFNLDAEVEAPILWPPDVKSRLIGKDPDAGKDWGQEQKWVTGWDGWVAAPSQWTWVWASSRSWWWTGKPGVLWFTESQRAGHNLGPEQQQCSVTNHNGKEYGKMENDNDREHIDTYTQLNHFAIHQKLTQHCKSAIL